MNIRNTEKADPMDLLFKAMIEGTTGLIEGQAASGQRQLVASSQLPSQDSYGKEVAPECFADRGIEVKGPSEGDPLFLDVVLPAGWSIKATEHSMWSELINERGEKAADIFYKAAFYDRKAWLAWIEPGR